MSNDERFANLAELLRDRCMVRPGGTLPDDGLSPSIDVRLQYEPRCWAVSPSGTRIAVGTKAGQVVAVSFRDGCWVPSVLKDAPLGHGAVDRHAARGLVFLGDDHVLVGAGARQLELWNIPSPESRAQAPRPPQEPWPHLSRGEEPLAWATLQRIRRMFPLIGGATDVVPDGPIAGIRRLDGTYAIVVLEQTKLSYVEPGSVIDWNAAGAPLVDADDWWVDGVTGRSVLAGAEDGALWQVSTSNGGVAIKQVCQLTLPVKRKLRAVRTGPWGALLRAGPHSVAVLPWAEFDHPEAVEWRTVRDNKDLVAWAWPGVGQPLWIAGASASATGLRWWRWPRTGGELSARPAPLRAEHGMSDVLGVLAWSGQGGPGPWIAAATRDNMLRIRHLVDRGDVRSRLEGLAGVAPLLTTAGSTLWAVRRELWFDLGSSAGAATLPRTEPWQLPQWRLSLDANDLRLLMDDLVSVTRSSTGGAAREGFSAADLLHGTRRWALRIFRRVSELRGSASGLGAELQRTMEDGLAGTYEGWRDWSLPGEHEEVSIRLRQLLRHLNKWVTWGHTYRENSLRLQELVHWNRRCGRDLDALVYQLKLMGQRFDRLWRSDLPRPEPDTAVVAIVHHGRRSIQAHIDGRVTACGADGETLAWRAARGGELGPLEVTSHALVRRGNARFQSENFVGAHARAIAVVDDPNCATRFWLLIAFRATDPDWLQDDQRSDGRPLLLRVGVEVADGQQLEIRVVEEIQAIGSEVYELRVIEQSGNEARVVVGMDGVERGSRSVPARVWTMGFNNERVVDAWSDLGVLSAIQHRSTGYIDEIQFNPVWASAFDGEAVWLGQEDGRLHRFLRFGEGWARDPLPPFLLDAGEPIRAIAAWRDDVSKTPWLAWGTRRGTVGAAARLDGEWRLIALHQNRGEVRAILPLYLSDKHLGDAAKDRRVHGFAAFFSDGSIALYDADLRPRGGRRRTFAGDRRDRIGFGALITAVSQEAGGEGVWWIGTADGQVERVILKCPRRSVGRDTAWNECRSWFDQGRVQRAIATRGVEGEAPLRACSSDVFGFAGAVGAEWVWRWLRVMDDAAPELVRYGLRMEVEQHAARVEDVLRDATESEALAGAVDEHVRVLRALADECFRHQPWSREPVKVVWSAAAKLANRVAASALRGDVDDAWRRAALGAYERLNRTTEAMSNQWIAAQVDAEGPVLMHSFAQTIDKEDVLLLASAVGGADGPGVDAERHPQYSVRRHLVRALLQPRLLHRDPLVVTQSLRVLNQAVAGALADPSARGRRFRSGGPKPNWMDVQTLVAEVPSRHGYGGDDMNPMMFEVARFFAGCLLLCPDESLAVGMVLGEASLVDARANRAPVVAAEVIKQVSVLRTLLGVPATELDPANHLEQYLKPREHKKLLDGAREWPRPDTDDTLEGWYSDEDLRRELKLVRGALDDLKSLRHPRLEGDDRSLSLLREARSILGLRRDEVKKIPAPIQCRYFSHTRRAFEEIHAARERIFEIATAGSAKVDTPWCDCKSIEEVISEVRGYLKYNVDLFAPFRELYFEIPQAWEDATDKLSTYIRQHDRCTRHRHQPAAADAMAAMLDLVVSEIAIDPQRWMGKDPPRTLIRQALEHDPQLLYLFDRLCRLVDEARISSILARAVLSELDHSKARMTWDWGTTSFAELVTLVRQVGEELKVGVETGTEVTKGAPQVPGPSFLWAAIFHELIQNVRRHAGSKDPKVRLWTQGRVLSLSGGDLLERNPGRAALTRMEGARHASGRIDGGTSFGLAMVHTLARAARVEVAYAHAQAETVASAVDVALNTKVELVEAARQVTDRNVSTAPISVVFSWQEAR